MYNVQGTGFIYLLADCAFAAQAAADAVNSGKVDPTSDGHYIVSFLDRTCNETIDYHLLVYNRRAVAVLHRRDVSRMLGNLQALTQKYAALWRTAPVRVV